MDDGRLEERAGTKFEQESCIMMCGNPDMLNDLEAQFAEQSIIKHKRNEPGQIVVERYW